MNSQEKAEIASNMADRFGKASAAFLVDYNGSTCQELTALKRRLGPTGAKMIVVKNTLAQHAVKGTPAEVLNDLFKGPTAVVWAGQDPVQPAKLITEFAKEKEHFKVKGGVLDGALLSSAQVEDLAKLPSREEMLGRLLAMINAPATKLLQTINAPASSLLRVFDAWRGEIEKKS